MKKVLRIISKALFALPFLLISVFFFIQSPIGKHYVKKKLITYAKEKGYTIEIKKLKGSLPLEWTLEGVTFFPNDENPPLTLDRLHARIALSPLFNKQISVTHLKIHGASYREVPFTLTAKGRVDLLGKKPFKLEHALIEGKDLFLRTEGKLTQDLSIREGFLAFSFPDLSLFSPAISEGKMMGTAQITKTKASFDCSTEDITLLGHPFTHTTLSLNAKKRNNWWEGKASGSGGHLDIPLEGKASFRFTPRGRLLSMEKFSIEGPNLSLFGKIDLDPSFKSLEGMLLAQCQDLKVLRPLFPGSEIQGRLGAKIDLQTFSSLQDLKCQVEVEDFSAFNTECHLLTLESTLYDLFGDLRGEFSLEGSQIAHDEVELSMMEIKSNFDSHASPFSFAFTGDWKAPFDVKGGGKWQKRGKGIFVNMNEFIGSALEKPFSLCSPFSFEWNPDQFKMSNLALDIASGHLTSRIDLTRSTSLIKLSAENFPLEFIPLPFDQVTMQGLGTLDIDLVSWEDNIQGSCNVSLKRAELQTKGGDPVTTKGSLQLHLSGGQAQIHGEIKGPEKQFLHFFGRLPIRYQHFPFQVRIDSKKPLAGELIAEGKLEEIFNFVNIGSHRVEGWLSTKLLFSKTLENPWLTGWVDLQDGIYENYYIGTELKNIELKGRFQQNSLLIESLTATDGNEGEVDATGSLLLSPAKGYPFSITANLKDADTVSFDTISGKFSGEVTISGNREASVAKGKLKVTKATFRIPDELPTIIPVLPITFINAPEHLKKKSPPPPTGSPLLLDLEIDAPGNTYVEGRGLTAELKGKLHITGTYVDIAADGKLQLVNGEFPFSGKVFNLTQGELIFSDKPTPSAYISLSGTCDLPEVTVTAILRGPMSEPKLTFQSNPQLPTSSILSQILFNKDISEISAVQALQVAQTVISLSGNSAPDILGKIRKSLGIDRLTILTSENDPGKISLQIGKYLMKGVLLTLSQGAESRNVAVEVDLKQGITLQAEVNEDSQGKFSLKWHHHY
ncbi:MAG: hypothetical protein KR126chlam1_00391 [Chlamydiae bacterium]|nr:hypothetical protein [Chlamydiota bacterium]